MGNFHCGLCNCQSQRDLNPNVFYLQTGISAMIFVFSSCEVQ